MITAEQIEKTFGPGALTPPAPPEMQLIQVKLPEHIITCLDIIKTASGESRAELIRRVLTAFAEAEAKSAMNAIIAKIECKS